MHFICFYQFRVHWPHHGTVRVTESFVILLSRVLPLWGFCPCSRIVIVVRSTVVLLWGSSFLWQQRYGCAEHGRAFLKPFVLLTVSSQRRHRYPCADHGCASLRFFILLTVWSLWWHHCCRAEHGRTALRIFVLMTALLSLCFARSYLSKARRRCDWKCYVLLHMAVSHWGSLFATAMSSWREVFNVL